jgi:hypothetical protein
MRTVAEVGGVGAEFSGAELGDRRRVRRLIGLAQALDEKPEASYPDATMTDAALEGAYRLLSNDAVSADGILAGHYEQTVERAAGETWVVAVHDTTTFQFSGETREGLGKLYGKGRGFFGHFTLLVAPGELRRPLGVLGLQTVVRKKLRGNGTPRPAETVSESVRWRRGVELAEQRVNGRCSLIHVMDREGDSYELWAAMLAAGHRFVIRNRFDRPLAEATPLRLSHALESAKTVIERMVELSPRKQEKIVFSRHRYPARRARLARLALSAVAVEIRRSSTAPKDLPTTLSINFVRVREVETHGENQPVEWTLATTEPINTADDLTRVVDAYRARWMIEEYFKAIKTGCAFEKRQLESMHSLLNALAVFVPIAWRLLLLRTLARDASEEPATSALTDTQLAVLRATSKSPMPPHPTVRDAMLAVARLGGHIKNNGEPGWAVLGRGFQKLLAREEGWIAALAARSDQS